MAASAVMKQLHSRLQLPSACCSSGSVFSGSATSASPDSRQAVAFPLAKGVARPVAAEVVVGLPLAVPGIHDWRSWRRGAAVCCSAVGNSVDSSSLRYGPVQGRQVLTLYDILGVSSDATDRDLQLAFRCMAKKYHPDHAPPEAVSDYQTKFLELRRAYDVLKDQRSRALYDFEIRNSPKYWAHRLDSKNRQWRGRNWETDQCWTS